MDHADLEPPAAFSLHDRHASAPRWILLANSGARMMDRERLQHLRQAIEEQGRGLPPELCRGVADMLQMTDVTFALIGSSSRRLTLCGSSDNALALDHWQFTLDQGPCLDAAATGQPTAGSTDPASESPWPQLAEKAAELGYGAIGGIPLSISGQTYGAMNIQNDTSLPAGILDDAEEVSRVLSHPIMSRLAEQVPALVDMADYSVVHQAAGMVSAQMGVAIEDALALLRARAWTEGRLLAVVATEVVNRDVEFDQSPGED
jgi:hypothetical protein